MVKRLPTISHICSALLDLIEHSKNRDICCISLNLLSRIAYLSSALTNEGNEDLLKDLLVDSLKRLIPGFFQTFFRVITDNDKIGSNVKMVYAILTVNKLVQAALNACSALLPSVSQNEHRNNENVQDNFTINQLEFVNKASQGHFKNSLHVPSITISQLQNRLLLSHMTSLIATTVDSIINIQLDLDLDKNVRLSTSFAHWLGVLLLKCHSLMNVGESQHLRYTQNKSSLIAQKLLADFTALHETNVNAIIVPKSLSNLFGNELIRKVGFDYLTEQMNFFVSKLFNLLGKFI
ncbi:TELO2-interacting protein 1-like protein [Schistosoma japonicum]|nr:TELO2-interacting protein 1-like protein [Schistosoma japonicum]